MKRYLFSLYILLMGVTVMKASSISVGDLTMKPGETKTVTVRLSNTEKNLVGFQMDLSLPEGITLNKSGCSLSSRFIDSSQELTIGKQTDGSYRLISTSMNLKPISGTSGTLLTLSLKASNVTAGGTATIRNIVFVTSTSQSVTMSNTTFSVNVENDGVTITAKSYTIEYGDELPTFEFTTTGADLKGTPVITCSATNDSDAGTYTIKVSKGSVSNESVTLVDGTLTIKKAPLTVSVGNYTKKQGDAMPTFEITYSGFKKGQTESVLTKKPTASCTATASSGKGTYPITLSGGQATNYDFNYQNGTLTVIDADAVAVTAKSYTITYGDELPKYEYTVSGGTLNGTPSISCSATSSSDAGEYDIIVSQGSVSSYNVTYIKGKLTIKRATLTASVGNYTRKPGEENPKFEITYTGFKKNQNKSVLEEEPTISCSADKNSPSGTYEIILSGGKAKNYDFKYSNGVLSVMQTYSLSISTTGNGSVVFKGESFKDDIRSYTVFEDESYMVRFNPENGYQLGKLTLNGEDVTTQVKDNIYTLSNVKKEIKMMVSFKEESGTFTTDGINYEIISSSDATVRIVNGNYTGHISIPASVAGNGKAWKVTGIESNAFNGCKDLISVNLPNSLSSASTGISLFTGCSSLAAITWNASFAIEEAILGSINNANLLLYVKNASYAPSNIKNVVVNGSAKEIVLSDAESDNNFYCPTTFTAEKISYTHRFGMESGYSSQAKGWETIALPFAVSEITHESKGKLLPFGKWNSSSSEKPFWLCNLSSNGFTRATSIQANTPYIICMPNNSSEYEDEYNLSGNVTFSATNAKVSVSNSVTTAKSNGKTFIPAFCAQEKASGVYALNVNNSYHSELGGYTEGSAFVSGLRAVSPFEAYMTTDANNAKRAFLIEFSETTGIDEMPSADNKGGLHKVFNLNGQLVKKANSQSELDETLKQLPTGVYIINGKKTVIKR